jgi:hypothetical protein
LPATLEFFRLFISKGGPVLVRIQFVAKPGHSSVVVKVPDMDLIFLNDFPTRRFDYEGTVNEGHNALDLHQVVKGTLTL